MTAAGRWRGRIVLLAAVVGVLVTLRLGAWQLDRAAQKNAMQVALDSRAALPALTGVELATDAAAAPAQHYRHVRLRGRWQAGRTLFLDNRPMNGRVGFYVVTPLLIGERGDAVLVQRGWVARDSNERTRLPALVTPAGEIEIDGSIAPPPGRLYEFAPSGGGVIRQNLELPDFSLETGLRFRPLSVLQTDSAATAGDGLKREWLRPAVDIDKHYGYAFQWFALAALMAGLYVWFQLVRPRFRLGA